MSRRARRLRQLLKSDPVDRPDYTLSMDIWRVFGRTDYAYVKEVAPCAYDKINDRIKVATESAVELDQDLRAIAGQALTPRDWTPLFDHLNVDLSTRALEAGGNLAAILGKLDVLLSTRARLQPWYQANFADGTVWYGATAGPHGDTQRGSYTVPANRIAIITSATGEVNRSTAATTVGHARVYFKFAGLFGGPVACLNSNTAGDHAEIGIGQGHIIKAGEAAECYSSDASTGGTVSFYCPFTYVVFDA